MPYSSSTTPSTPSTDPIASLNALTLCEFTARFFPSDTLSVPANPKLHSSVPPTLLLRFSTDLSSPYLNAAFKLIEQTSGRAYRASSDGWRPREKKKEMKLLDMKYILLVAPQSSSPSPSPDPDTASSSNDPDPSFTPLLGFTSFMFTHEDSYPVLYIYEIHLQPSIRGYGYGKSLIKMLERVGREAGVRKVMLTVFEDWVVEGAKVGGEGKRGARGEEAKGARGFYERLGFEVDEFSPPAVQRRLRGKVVRREVEYVILSKTLQRDAGGEG